MDPLFVVRPQVPPQSSTSLWQAVPNISASNNIITGQQLQHPSEAIEYHYHNGARSFSSPPSTPMTPVPHHLQHIGGFPPHIDTTGGSGGPPTTPQHPLVLYNVPSDVQPTAHPPPALSHSVWPIPCEYRLYTMCQELQDYPTNELINEETSKSWWDRFMIDYFHELANLIIEIDFGEGMQRYTVNHNYISWFFKSILHENGITRLNIVLGQKSIQQQSHLQRVVCNNAVQELEYVTPHQTKVCSQGQLLVDFTMEDKPRVLRWVFHVINNVELIPRFCLHAASLDASLSNNITLKGFPAATQALLQQLNQSPSVSSVNTPRGKAPPPTGSSNNNNNIRPSDTCPPQLINFQDVHPQGVASSPWQDNILPPVVQQSTDSGGALVLSHPPLTQSPPTSTHAQLTSTAPPTSISSSPATSPIGNYINLHSNGSTCSVNSTCSSVPAQPTSLQLHQTQPHTAGTQSHATGNQNQTQGKGLSKKGINGPVIKAHKFMIASEPAYFSEDMVHGEDERLITRIENTRITPASTTPMDTSSEVATPTQQMATSHSNMTLSWLDSVQCSWNIQMPPEQR